MNRLRIIRIISACIVLLAVTLLFLDFTGTLHRWMGWMAKVQFLPALLALNVGVVIGLLLLTLLFGRVYCSVICPLGLFQDLIARLNRKKNKYRYSRPLSGLRYSLLALFVIAFLAEAGAVVALLEPYSAYGRIASNLFAPFYGWTNNVLAYIAERTHSYAFYSTDVWMKSIATFAIALVTLVTIVVLAWRGGRSYCNTICPVGTILGFVSRFSLYKHRIDTTQCNECGLCARNCKAACIDAKAHTIDYSRCVSCFNCIDKCHKKAIHFGRNATPKAHTPPSPESVTPEQVDTARRQMLTLTGALAATSLLKAQEKKVDGGLAFIEDKKIPKRQTAIVPPGGQSHRHFTAHCTGCQLCVSVCTNQVLRPSTHPASFMMPELSFERGYCRPECTKCSEVCPTGAIRPLSIADKSATQVGHAVWVEKNCVVLTDGVECGNCARHCPTGAITMVDYQPDSLDTRKIPVVNEERCIGCGACEHLCPSRPFSAIYVEGHLMHKTL